MSAGAGSEEGTIPASSPRDDVIASPAGLGDAAAAGMTDGGGSDDHTVDANATIEPATPRQCPPPFVPGPSGHDADAAATSSSPATASSADLSPASVATVLAVTAPAAASSSAVAAAAAAPRGPAPVRVLVPMESFDHLTNPAHQESARRIVALAGACLRAPGRPPAEAAAGPGAPGLPVVEGALLRADVNGVTARVVMTRRGRPVTTTADAASADDDDDADGQGWPYLPLSAVALVHEPGYLRHIAAQAAACARAERSSGLRRPATAAELICPAAPASVVYRQVLPVPYGSLPGSDSAMDGAPGDAAARCAGRYVTRVDSDTWVGSGSLDAALAAATAAADAVDDIAAGRESRVMVVARPPGHHAGVRGCVPSRAFALDPAMASSGFGLINVAAVAAAYARSRHGGPRRGGATGGGSAGPALPRRLRRVAIVDIDVHHGNGTEEIVRALRHHRRALPLPGSFAPVEEDVYRPWLDPSDASEVLFASVHVHAGGGVGALGWAGGRAGGAAAQGARDAAMGGAGGGMYPETGGEGGGGCDLYGHDDSDDGLYPAGVVNVALPPIAVDAGPGKRRGERARREACAEASAAWRGALSSLVLPRLRALRPDLLVISAGFDASEHDGYYWLTDADFEWAGGALCEAADAGRGRGAAGVVSVLEGGYATAVKPAGRPAGKPAGKPGRRKVEPAAWQTGPEPAAGDCGLGRCVTAFVRGLARS